MDTLGVIQEKPYTSKLAITSLITSLIGGLFFLVFILFLIFVLTNSSISKGLGLFFVYNIYLIVLIPNVAIVFGIVAIVVGILSLCKIHKHPDLIKGKGISWLGIVTGCLTIMGWIGLAIFLFLHVRI